MMSMSRIFLTILCLVIFVVNPASASIFGAAGDYNLFTSGNATLTNSDAEGSVAIGGTASLTNYSVASNRSGSDARLVVGGGLTYTNGQVGQSGSGTIYAASAALTGTNPATFATTGSGLDFIAAADYLKSASTAWKGLATTGSAVNNYGTITLTGNNAGLNVFSLDGSDLNAAYGLNINAQAGSTVLINVSGTASGLTNMGISLQGGIQNTNVLYNFYEATQLTFSGVGIQGSVLSPLAAVDFDNGNINGQMFAFSLEPSSGEFHDVGFTGQLSPVPLPGAVWLLSSGFITLAGFRKKLRS